MLLVAAQGFGDSSVSANRPSRIHHNISVPTGTKICSAISNLSTCSSAGGPRPAGYSTGGPRPPGYSTGASFPNDPRRAIIPAAPAATATATAATAATNTVGAPHEDPHFRASTFHCTGVHHATELLAPKNQPSRRCSRVKNPALAFKDGRLGGTCSLDCWMQRTRDQ
jgi:hypothetical protein